MGLLNRCEYSLELVNSTRTVLQVFAARRYHCHSIGRVLNPALEIFNIWKTSGKSNSKIIFKFNATLNLNLKPCLGLQTHMRPESAQVFKCWDLLYYMRICFELWTSGCEDLAIDLWTVRVAWWQKTRWHAHVQALGYTQSQRFGTSGGKINRQQIYFQVRTILPPQLDITHSNGYSAINTCYMHICNFQGWSLS